MDQIKTAVWHVVISGFTQRANTPHGMFRLWKKLCNYRNASTAVELHPWNAQWDELAETIFLCSNGTKPKINVYCYSYGCGWGMVRFCKALKSRGLEVSHVCSSDGVYRHPYRLGAWRSFFPWSRIVVPRNVHYVSWFRQKETLLHGHTLLAEDPRATYIEKPVVIRADHVYMDDAQSFHDECLRIAAQTHKVK